MFRFLLKLIICLFFFFFQAEDGIRVRNVTGVQTCALPISLSNAFYDVERFGIRFVASPRHADVLLVTGPVTLNMREALERTWAAMPAPKWVIAVGDCGAGCGVFADSYACVGAVSKVLPVDLVIRGCPPTPVQLLQGLLWLMTGAAAPAPPS